MRLSPSLLACTVCAIAAHSSKARTISARRTVGLEARSLGTLESLYGDAPSIEVDPRTLQLKDLRQDDRGLDALVLELDDAENVSTVKVTGGPESKSNSGRTTPGSESDSNDSDEQDLMSPPTPISEGRRRAGILGILGAIILTTALVYHLYTRRARLHEQLSSLPERFPFLTNLNLNWLPLPLSLPTLSLPTLSTPQRTRRRRLRRTKGGFRPHVSRLRAWAAETDVGLLNDYDTEYDGDYERGHASSGSTSSNSSLEAGQNEAFDLGADEDFMIGAPRRGSSPSSGTASSGSGSGKAVRGVGKVWGRLKGARASKSSASISNMKRSGNGTVLFAVAESGDMDFDLDDDGMERETDEALPLAPTPYRFGSGSVKGYGSAS